MDKALTVGMVFEALVVLGGIALLIGIGIWILSIFADAWKH